MTEPCRAFYDLESFALRRRRTHNNEKRDAQLLYVMALASWRAHYSPQGARHDSFLAHVMRNAV